ncbi:type III secretion system invasion protein IagB [Chromobacterium amazonense]|uniref:type III secretion system invasion protein IagB n=1 Tax=Chromobacterium amazonense TaxID=1382803 RepID=UPI003F7A31E7
MRRLALALLLCTGAARAGCWDRAGAMYSIAPELLYAIAEEESALNPTAVGHNRDGSRDLGLMQINSRHLLRLQKLGISETQLLQDSCLSIIIGASILSDMMKRYGYSWEAVGAYNAGTAADRYALRMRYAKRVWQRYQRLVSEDNVRQNGVTP